VRPDQFVFFPQRERNWLTLLKLAAGGIVTASVAAAATLSIIPETDAPRVERPAVSTRVLRPGDLQLAPYQTTGLAPIQRPLEPRPTPFQTTDVAPTQLTPIDPQPLPFQTTLVAPMGREIEYPLPRETAIENVPLPHPRPKPKPVRKVASAPKKNTTHAYAPVECGWDKYKNKVPSWMRKCPQAPLSLTPPIPFENFFENLFELR
jgi:hypothetical protein